MIGRVKTWAAAVGAAVVLMGATNAYTYVRTYAVAYERGLRDERIRVQSKTAMLNYRLREARDEARSAALDAEDQRRALTKLERDLADERARDPLAGGQCISPDGLRRIFRVP